MSKIFMDQTGQKILVKLGSIARSLEILAEKHQVENDTIVTEHNAILRRLDHGEFTEAHSLAIQAGIFTDFYPGDSFTINGRKYLILELDPYYDNGTDEHHLMMMPEDILYTQRMNSTNTTYRAYANSEMHLSGLDSAKATIAEDFGAEHILSYKKVLSSGADAGNVTDATEELCTVELLTQCQVLGSTVYNKDVQLAELAAYIDYNHQLALFKMLSSTSIAKYEGTATNWWLRDIYTGFNFFRITATGGWDSEGASSILGVRPGFLIH